MSALTTVVVSAVVAAVVALATDFMKARMSTAYWVAQERWKLKSNNYTALVTALTKLRGVAADLRSTAAAEGAVFKVALDQFDALHQEVAVQQQIARLWLSAEALTALDEMVKGFKTLPDDAATGWPQHFQTVERVSALLMEVGRRELMAV